jgi:hypothetical protein
VFGIDAGTFDGGPSLVVELEPLGDAALSSPVLPLLLGDVRA